MKHSFSKLLLLFSILILASSQLFAQTAISGTIGGDSTIVWGVAGSPYVISGSTTISTLDTVVVEPGVEVQFANGAQLYVSGALMANQASFTASSTGATRETWNRIVANTSESLIHLRRSSIQFAKHGIEATAGTVLLDTVNITDSKYGLVLNAGTQTTIKESIFTGNAYPIYLNSEAAVSYMGTNDFSFNDADAVYIAFSQVDQNWELTHPGIPYYAASGLNVTLGDTLTIDSQNIIKVQNGREILINDGATLIAEANTGEEIFFTSIRNDNIGGDTNADGTTTAPANNDWYGIRIAGQVTNSRLKRINVSFAGYVYSYNNDYRGGVTFQNNNSTVDSSSFFNNYYGMVIRNGSDATVTNNTIGSSGIVPVALTFDSDPVFTNNEFNSSNNQYDAIGLIGTTITGVNSLPIRNFTTIPNVTYLLLSELYVDTGASLDIEPGVVIKSAGSGIRVKGTLTSDGTAADSVVFTSVKDDNVGNPNDTNKDGNSTVPGNSDWRGLAFGEDAGASLLDFNVIRYATYNTSFYYNDNNDYISPRGAVNIMSGDVTITNSDISNTTNYAIDSRGIAKPQIMYNDFSNTGSVPVALDLSSDPTFEGNTITNVGMEALGYHGGTLNNDGIIRNRDFAGYSNITTVILENVLVESGTTLTVEPGTVVKMNNVYNGVVIRVAGALNINGTADSLVYFTSIKDDNLGNPMDTNGDGLSSSAAPNDWGSIRFLHTADDVNSSVEHTSIRFSKHGMIFSNAAPSLIDNVTILNCQYMGFAMEGGSTVHISNSTIQNCGWDPIAISTTSHPTFSNITFNSNGTNGVSLLESNYFYTSTNGFNAGGLYFNSSNTMATNATISPYTIAGYQDLPFILRYQFYIGDNTTISVSPKTIFKGSQTLYVDGAFRVNGSESNPVIFTSLKDDSAGDDSNNDGNDSSPDRNESLTLRFRPSSIDSLNLIKNAQFRYSGNSVYFESADAVIDSSLFQLTYDHAIKIHGSSAPTITNNRFENIGSMTGGYRRHSIFMDMFTNPTFAGNIESNVSFRGLGINSGTWASDATIPFRDFAGSDSITYVLHGNITVPSGTKIIIPDGMVFKKNTNYGTSRWGNFGFIVHGALKVRGTESNPVVLTSDTDDSFGTPSDLYTDGSFDDSHRSGKWITYSGTSDDTANVVTHTYFRQASIGVEANGANPRLRNSHFENLEYGISMTGVSEPFVENNDFYDLNYTPMLTSLVSYPQSVFGNTMGGRTFKAIGVRSETLVQDVTLPKRTFAGKVGIPYYFVGTYTVGTNAVLTIEPGVVNKFNNYAGLNVQKGLIAQGGSTPDSMIVFTSILDDFYSGDTNSDSSYTTPGVNNWYGIKYQGTSLEAQSLLDYVIVKHARGGSSYAGIVADNSSPTITNSIISKNATGVLAIGSANPVINFSDIYDNTEYGVNNRDKTFNIDATQNWWGNDSGPTHASNPTGTGDEITDQVNYNFFSGSGAGVPLLGDVSLNGSVQSFDASKVLRAVALLETLSATQNIVADVSGDGSVTSMDASYILQYVVGLIEAFPEELNSKVRHDRYNFEGVEDIILSIGERNEHSDEVVVPLNFDNVSDLYAYEINLAFDSTAFELVSVAYADVLKNTSTIENTASGKTVLVMASTKAIESSGTLVEVTFRKKDASANQTINIEKFIANETDLTLSSVANELVELDVPESFQLYQNYPNPFNPTTTIGFDVPDNNTMVRMEVYNIIGQRVKTLVSDVYSAGRYSVRWDGTNDAGVQVSTGVYIYRVQAGNVVQSKKLTFIK